MLEDLQIGISLKIVSWENDGDCYNTDWVHGLTSVEAKVACQIAKAFDCVYSGGVFGGDSKDVTLENLPSYVETSLVPNPGELLSLIRLSIGSQYESDCSRVCESCTAYSIEKLPVFTKL